MLETASAVRRVLMPDRTSWPEMKRTVEDLLHTCDRLIAREAPNWLGHCKVLAETTAGCCYASITGVGEPLGWRGSLVGDLDTVAITLYCVACGPSEPVLERVVAEALVLHLPNAYDVSSPDPLDDILTGTSLSG